jgi:ABC-type multidrug transport system ATPase subunit
MEAPLLEAVGIRKRYGEREALTMVSLEVRAGELVACIGPNGAGKTTLLSVLAGVVEPDGGQVTRRDRIGWVPQRPALYAKLSVADNLRLFAHLERAGDPDAAVSTMLAQAGLAERAADPVAELSAGNRQRVNIAAGLVAGPPIVLLDEPTAALDVSQREVLWDFVKELAARGTAIVYSTHIVEEAEQHADRVLVLAAGQPLFWGPVSELRERVAAGDGSFEEAFVSFLREHAL